MTTEPARHALYARLEEVLGPEHATTLMTHLPPEPPGQLATRSDIGRLEGQFGRLEGQFERLEGRFERLEGRFDQLTVEFREMRAETKADIDRIEDRFDKLSGDVNAMHGVMRDQLRTYTVTTVGAMTALTAIFAAVVTTVA